MTMRALSRGERLDWLRLSRTRGVGPVTFAGLIQRFGSASAALDALPELMKSKGRKNTLPGESEIERELDAIERHGARLLCSCEPDFPALLKQVSPPPPVLTIFGDLALLGRKTVAIVGARNASAAGRKMARDLANELGRNGYVIVSGLARGIDGEAHAAALQSGTVAVLAGGVDQAYPPQHRDLYRAIADQGVLVSESPFGHVATAKDFPRRNRIITGLSLGTIVVEAAERSGSLISACTALEQNRDVMAVPGSPLEPRSAGTNHLIRQGATLVRSAGDIIDQLRTASQGALFEPTDPFGSQDSATDWPSQDDIARVKQALSSHPMPMDEIARAADLTAPRCAAVLMELELLGFAITLAGGLACLNHESI